MMNPVQESKTNIAIGQDVKVRDGVLKGFTVSVQDVDLPAGKVTVLATMLGREQTIELDLDQIEALER
jgi:transcription antitermination factor NusG